jgi:uncharacterized membrane protein YedE/YeeE
VKLKLAALGFGAAFGFWLCWTGFIRHDLILDTLLLRDFYLWGVFAGAVAINFTALRLLARAGARTWIGGAPIEWTIPKVARDHVLGALLFGTGWAIAGSCPGPAVAQIGAGRLSGVILSGGMFAGVLLRGLVVERRAAAAEKRAALAEAAVAPSM